MGQGRESGGRGYLDDAAAPFHVGQRRAGHIHQSAAVQIDHGIHGGIGNGLPIAELAEAGRVHQERDAGIFRGKRCANVRDVGLAGEVGGYRAGGRVQLAGHVGQGLLVARDQPQLVGHLLRVQLPRELAPQPGGRARDDGYSFRRIHGKPLF